MKHATTIVILWILLCIHTPCATTGKPLIITVNSAKLDSSLELNYVVKNTSGRNIYVFSPFLNKPFSGEFDKAHGSEMIWATIKPDFQGNYLNTLEFITIVPGQTYAGHLVSAYAGEQIRNCTNASTVPLRLTIGWGYDTEKATEEWKKDMSDSVKVVRKWQSLAVSDKYVIEKTGKGIIEKCPQQQSVEIWR